MTRPEDWLLEVNETIDRKYEVTIGELENLLLENTGWVARRREELQLQQEQLKKKLEAKKKPAARKGPKVQKPPQLSIERKEEALPEKPAASIQKKPRGRPKKILKTEEKKTAVNKNVLQEKEVPKTAPRLSVADPAMESKLTPSEASTVFKASNRKRNLIVESSPICPPSGARNPSLKTVSLAVSPIVKNFAGQATANEQNYEPESNSTLPTSVEESQSQPVTSTAVMEPEKLSSSFPKAPVVERPLATLPSESEPKVESWMSHLLKKESFASGPSVQPADTRQPDTVQLEQNSAAVQCPADPPRPKPQAINNVLALEGKLEGKQTAGYEESPLTRAKRIDSQNTWREQQLSKFFVSKSELLKSSLNALREVKHKERISSLAPHGSTNVEPVMTVQTLVSPTRPVDKVEQSFDNFDPEVESSAPTPRLVFKSTTVAPEEKPSASPLKQVAVPDVVYELPPPSVIEAALPRSSAQIQNISEEAPPPEPDKLSIGSEIWEIGKLSGPHGMEDEVRKKRPTDVFQADSPLKRLKVVVPQDADFIGAFTPPQLKLVEDPVVPEPANGVVKMTPVDDVFAFPAKETQGKAPVKAHVTVDKEEELKRERLKERQRMAIERRNQLIKKAQEAKAPKIDDATIFKPKILNAPRPNQQSGSNIMRPGVTATASALHKTAMMNSSKAASIKPDFKIPATKPKSPAPVKMAEKILSSPNLPEIPSDDEDLLKRIAKNAHERPDWAQTPALREALVDQSKKSAGKIFQQIQPVRLEDIFKNRVFKRNRNSSIPFP